MRRAFAGSVGLLAALLSGASFAALKEGDAAPAFKAEASLDGKAFAFSLQDALKKGPVVVYFYPAAFTGGCSIQAHTFAVNQEKFAAAGASIVGVSLDRIAVLNEFSADPASCAGKIPLASDADGRIAQAFELNVAEAPLGRKNSRGHDIDHGRAERSTFVVTPDGKIAATVGGVAPDVNALKALEAVQKLAAGKKS